MSQTKERILPKVTAFTRLRASLLGETMAEFFGTFVLILLGVGSVAVAVVGLPGSGRQPGPFGPADWIIVGFGWCFAVVFGVYVAGGISGAHLNPAITLAFAVRRNFDWRKVVPFWLAQIAGAFCGAAVAFLAYQPAINDFNATEGLSRPESLGTWSIFATFPAPFFHGSHVGPLITEIIGTAILVTLVAALTDNRNQAPTGNMAPLLIGFAVVVIGFSYGANTGYAINPARDLGPRLFTYLLGWGELALPGNPGETTHYWWVPIVGPVVGGLIGILLYDVFIGHFLEARATMLRPPEPGLTPIPTNTAAAGVAGPVTVEADADAVEDSPELTGPAQGDGA